MGRAKRGKGFFQRHSLSITSSLILLLWVILYAKSSPETHWGAFFGNAIADWSGLVVMILATKRLYERGSKESRKPPKNASAGQNVLAKLQQHSLTLFLVITGLAWVVIFGRMDPTARWGQVVGNIVSEWTQVLGIVVLTKELIEVHSKE